MAFAIKNKVQAPIAVRLAGGVEITVLAGQVAGPFPDDELSRDIQLRHSRGAVCIHCLNGHQRLRADTDVTSNAITDVITDESCEDEIPEGE